MSAWEALEAELARLARSRERLRSLSQGRALAVLAPPWNRISRELAAALPTIGIRGLSGYGETQPLKGIKQINTHVDIVAWRERKGFIGDEQALRLAMNSILEGGPVGWLTHHAVHDEAAW